MFGNFWRLKYWRMRQIKPSFERTIKLDCAHRAKTYAKATNLNKKMIRDSNPDFRINPDSIWMTAGSLQKCCNKTHYLVGVSHFAKCRKNWLWGLYNKC